MPHHSSMHSIAKQTLPLCCSLRHLTQPSSIPLHPVRSAGMSSSSTRLIWGPYALPLPKLPSVGAPRAQQRYSNNSRAHRRLRETDRLRAVATHARRIFGVRWTLRSGVYALSEVSMNDVRCAGSRRNIGLTRIRKRFSCCLNRCSALVSSATLLRQRYDYIYIFSSACWRIYTTISTLIQLGLRGRPSRMYSYCTTSFCSSTVVPTLQLCLLIFT